MRKWITCLLLIVLACLCAQALAEEFKAFPDAVRFTQRRREEEVRSRLHEVRTIPKTACPSVDSEITALIDSMMEDARGEFSMLRPEYGAYLDAGALISWTGDRLMSFLVLCETTSDTDYIGCSMEARTYDMTTGERVALTALFDEDSPAWDVLSHAVREQLTIAFPRLIPKADALDALCTKEALMDADFTLGTMRLTLHYPARVIYPGKDTLLHVDVRYAQLRDMMTEFGRSQTDNSGYRMVALTFDDGQVRYSTRRVLDELRNHGAQATFFIVGEQMRNNHDNLSLEQNHGYSLQSHTYDHKYFYQIPFEKYAENEARFAEEMSSLIGVAPTMLRAPGGSENYYAAYDLGYPIMHWSLAAGDSGDTRAESVVKRIHYRVISGDVILMHETNGEVRIYARDVMDDLAAQDYLFLTLEDLYEAYGIELRNNEIYFSPTFVPVD